MANPQKEHGFTPIANEILEALSKVNLNAYQWRFLMVLFRKTYGFRKKADWIANSQIVEMTGIDRRNVSRAKRQLAEMNIVISRDDKISFNKDYDTWSMFITCAKHVHKPPKVSSNETTKRCKTRKKLSSNQTPLSSNETTKCRLTRRTQKKERNYTKDNSRGDYEKNKKN